MKPIGFLNGISVAAALAVLAGCAVGPNYRTPAAPNVALTPQSLPAATAAADGKTQTFATAADISGDWWTLYHSPELNRLIAAALAHNPTLAASQATLLQAQENLRAAYGVFAPSVSGSFQTQREKLSTAAIEAQGGGLPADAELAPYTLYNATLSVSYSIDLFGLDRRQFEEVQAQQDYEQAELEAAYLTLTANIVTAAVSEASLQAQIDDTNKVIADEKQLLKILNAQVAVGGVAQANVLNQQATLAQSEASLPPLELQLAEARNQLADYVGVFPGDFHAADFTLGGLHLPSNIPVSLPSAIVAQRPDIVAAAAQLHQASAAVGVADANMLPQISLSADIGHEALTMGSLFTPQTLLWGLVGGVTQPIFEGGELAAKRKAAIAVLQASGEQYQATVLAAFQNVADALETLQYDALTLQAAQAAADAAQASLTVTQAQYRLGGEPLTSVLNAQTTYQNAAIAQVKATAARLADTAALYQALGGGWWHRQDVSAPCCGLIP
jgi:NodT family efflux transporter outer membrane factor (OMF) lipoprotein